MLPQHILNQFSRISRSTSIPNYYYGVFNTILHNVCFPNNDAYTIHPPTIDSLVTYVVEMEDLPVFFMEIKTPLSVRHVSSRIAADDQMRDRFGAIYNLTPIPRLHGVSAMGQKLAFYCMDKTTGDIAPEYVAPSRHHRHVIDSVPAGRWDTDITTEDGYQKFMSVIKDVREMAEAL